MISIEDCVEMVERNTEEYMRENPRNTDFSYQRREERNCGDCKKRSKQEQKKKSGEKK